MNLSKIVEYQLQRFAESQINKQFDAVVLDTFQKDKAFLRITGQEIELHTSNNTHLTLEHELSVRGQLRMLAGPDMMRFGPLHSLSTQLLSMVPSTGVSPLPVFQPTNPIGLIVTILSML